MITRVGATVDRFRRPIVLAVFLITVGAVTAGWFGAGPGRMAAILAVPLGLGLVLSFVMIIAFSRPKRAGFELDGPGPGFRTPRTGMTATFAVFHMTLIGCLLLAAVGDTSQELTKDLVTAAIGTAGFAFYTHALWHGLGVTLTPGGLRADKYTGSLTVPWEALDPARPPKVVTDDVEISYRRPELARTTGWLVRRRTVVANGVRPERIAAALRHYLDHPEERARIGTPDGLAGLLDAIGQPAETEQGAKRTGRGLAATVIVSLVVVAGMVEIGIWADDRFGDTSVRGLAVRVVTGMIAFAAAGFLTDAIRGYRRGRRG